MTDLEVVEAAVNATLKRARKENPGYLPIPITGYTIMEWFKDALEEAKEKKKSD